MANSGSTTIAVTSWDDLKFSWSESSQSVANNTTTISWKLELIAGNYGRISSSVAKDWSVTVNGTTYSGTNMIAISNNSTKTLASGTTTITHNSDGTKTFNYSFSQEIAITFNGSYIGTKSGSGSGTLDTIPRKSSLSVGNGTLDTPQTLKVTRQSTSFTHTITAKCGSASATICTKSTNTSINFTPPLSWASQNTTGTTVSVTYTITTYNGSTSVGSNVYEKTCTIPASVKPTCELHVTDPTGHRDTYGDYVMGISKINVEIIPHESYESAIAKYKTTINGRNYSSAKFTIDTPNDWGTFTITSTVTDKRGRTDTRSTDIRILPYSKPAIKLLSVHRCDGNGVNTDQGDCVKVTFDALVTDLSGKNTATYTVEYKKTTESDYTRVELTDYNNDYIPTDAEYVFEADTGSSYNVRVIASDNFDSGSKATTASTAFTIMHWLASGLGMAIGKIAELTGVLDIGFKTRFMGGILHPVLEPETDLDDVLTPNTYVGANVSTYNYGHCPLTSGTFTLEVIGMGEDGQVKQRLTYCHKTACRAWERIYYAGSWNYDEDVDPTGGWICVSDFGGTLLWSGVYYMSATQTATLSEPISKQRSGIVLVFSRYSSGVAQDYHFQTFFIPKYQVAAHPGNGHTFMLTTDGTFGLFAAKYLYINDDRIVGNAVNEAIGTGECGIKYTNNGFVLRHVIGV